MARLVYPSIILNIVSANIFVPFGKMTGMVRLRKSFILLYISDPFIHLEDKSSTSVYFDSSPHFGGVQSLADTRKDIFGRKDVVE